MRVSNFDGAKKSTIMAWGPLSSCLKRPAFAVHQRTQVDDGCKHAHVGQIDQIDHDIDHLHPNLPRRDAGQDMHTAVVQIQLRKCDLDDADYEAPTRKHELDHTDHTDQESICPERSRSSSGNRSYR